jgi:hypothetical protein
VHTEQCRANRACFNNATAGFIAYDVGDLYERPNGRAVEEGRAGAFDFDSLPVRNGEDTPCICAAVPAAPSSVALPLNLQEEKQPNLVQPPSSPPPAFTPSALPDETRCKESKSPVAILARAHYECNRNSLVEKSAPAIPASQKYKSEISRQQITLQTIETQYHRVRGVPAFGPLTRVLSPVVSRAQWEIVVRSAIVGLLISLIIVGSMVAIPVPH